MAMIEDLGSLKQLNIHCRPIYGAVAEAQKAALAPIYYPVILKAIYLIS
ncbi:hypothetical protein [Mucilaginibacter sp. FT3.2]|nr:hypothetical protein [Mucilaginibacter sp. FT3.2]MBB6231222.1 hypothetical protein [Mucilaginibacter sp. FT3.2]